MESLSSYCRRNSIPKSTAHKHLTQLGISTAAGMTQDAIAALEQRWPSQPQPAVIPEVMEPAAGDPLALYQSQPAALTFGHYQATDRSQETIAAMRAAAELAGGSAEQQQNFLAAIVANSQQLGQQAGMVAGLSFAQSFEASQQAILDQLAASKGLGKQHGGECPS